MSTSKKSGFTLVEIMIVVVVIGLLAAMALPNFIKNRQTSQLTICLSNLRTYQGELDMYIFSEGGYPSNLDDLVTTGYLKQLYECPLDGAYEWTVKDGNSQYHLLCNGQHTPLISHVCIHENRAPTAK